MCDRRVQKGNTYAAMVIPAGSYPEAMANSGKENIRPVFKAKEVVSERFKLNP